MTVMGTGRRKPPGQGSGLTRGLQAGAVRQGGDEESPALLRPARHRGALGAGGTLQTAWQQRGGLV